MADFIVLEEDGTSHLETEESSDDFITEESGPFVSTKAAAGKVGTFASGVGPPTPRPSFATWQVGTLTVPSSTGTQTITGLGGTPAAVIFLGTNWLTEDTAVTTAHTAMFRGMVSPQWDSAGTLVQQAACISPPGDAHDTENNAIAMIDLSGNGAAFYRASVTSLDADGFTLSWSSVQSGGYKIVYVALMDVANYGGYIGGSTTLSLGWKAGAMLLHGGWDTPTAAGDRTQEFYGGAAYPGTSGGSSWFGSGLTAFCFPGSAFQQYNLLLDNNAPSVEIAQGGNFSGPFLAPYDVTAYPSGGGLTAFTFSTSLAADNRGMLVMWDDEDSKTGRTTPATSTAGTSSVTGLSFAPGLVITYTISDEPAGLGSSSGGGVPSRGAAGFSVITPDFQWCATIDGTASGAGSFQSFQRGFADVVNTTNVHAGTVELTTDGFVLTTEEDDVSPANIVWHAFGHPKITGWIPQSYRRRH